MGKADVSFTLRFSARDGNPAFPSISAGVPSKRPTELDNSEPQAKRAKEAVEHAKAVTKDQKVVLDLLGNARNIVDGIQAILAAVGEVSQAHTIDANFAYRLISYTLLLKLRALRSARYTRYVCVPSTNTNF